MATASQILANRQNAARSTGPVTESGKATSSRNALTLGLYTRQDYVKTEEREIHDAFRATMYADLAPGTLLEETLTAEITGACAAVVNVKLPEVAEFPAELADTAA